MFLRLICLSIPTNIREVQEKVGDLVPANFDIIKINTLNQENNKNWWVNGITTARI